ncbi:hypothetical protein ACLBOM_28570 [Escherichia coli]
MITCLAAQLGASLMYEQYYGDECLFGNRSARNTGTPFRQVTLYASASSDTERRA